MDIVSSLIESFSELHLITKVLFAFIGFWLAAVTAFFGYLVLTGLASRLTHQDLVERLEGHRPIVRRPAAPPIVLPPQMVDIRDPHYWDHQ